MPTGTAYEYSRYVSGDCGVGSSMRAASTSHVGSEIGFGLRCVDDSAVSGAATVAGAATVCGTEIVAGTATVDGTAMLAGTVMLAGGPTGGRGIDCATGDVDVCGSTRGAEAAGRGSTGGDVGSVGRSSGARTDVEMADDGIDGGGPSTVVAASSAVRFTT